jgi:hypothetical protein
MRDMTKSKKGDVDEAKLAALTKRVLATPPNPAKAGGKERAKKPRAPNGLKDTPGVPGDYSGSPRPVRS